MLATPNPMRIGLNLLPWLPGRRGGLETYDRSLLRALLELDTDDTFVLFLSREAVGALGLQSSRLEEWGCPIYSRYRPLRALWEQTRFAPWVARSGVEVLFCPHSLLPTRCPVPMVQLVHDLQVFDLPENFSRLKRAYLYRRLPDSARRAARIIAISEFTCQSVVRNLRAPAEKTSVILEAASPDFTPRSGEEVAALRGRFGLQQPYLLCLSTSHKHKHLDRLVRAFDALKDTREGPEQLVLAGLPGTGETEFRAALEQARHREDIFHLGRLPYEELSPLYAGALGLVFPSCYEGFGLPVVEAMACGCPVACSDAGSLPEAAGGAALLFDCHSDQAVTAVMRSLLEEPALREGLRVRGLERVKSLTWLETARQTLEVLHQAARPSHTPSPAKRVGAQRGAGGEAPRPVSRPVSGASR